MIRPASTQPATLADTTADAPEQPRVALELSIETPENVVLTYQLAGPSIRCAAWLIDFGIRAAVLTGILTGMACFMSFLPGLSQGMILLLLFINEWGYFVICEGFFRGKTPGKHFLGLRVIREQGYPIDFWAALLRNLLRFVDAQPFLLHGVGLTSMFASPRFQRLGDRAARTVVITERLVVLPRQPVILERIDKLSRDDLNNWRPPHRLLTLIDEFLGRRHVLPHDRGHAVAATIARQLARKLDYRGDPELVTKYPMAFLARVYVTFLREDDELPEEIIEPPRDRSRRFPIEPSVRSSASRRRPPSPRTHREGW